MYDLLQIYTGNWTIFQGIGKNGGWILLQGELEVNGRGGGTFYSVGVDIFATTYLIYGPFTYTFFHYFNFNYVLVLFISAAVHNTWCIFL